MRRRSLLLKLFNAYLLPVLAMVALMAFFGGTTLRTHLDEEIGGRLADYAAATAALQRAEYLKELVPGDEAGSRIYHNALSRLMALQEASARVERLYIFTKDKRLVISTDPMDGGVGASLPKLGRDLAELEECEATKLPIASKVTFEGYDKKLYKSGFAPILLEDGTVWGFVGVDASAENFRSMHRGFRRTIWAVLAIGLLGMLGFAFYGDRLLLRPIRRLQRATGRIQLGDLKRKIQLPKNRKDELGRLAQDMDRMRERLLARDQEMQMMLSGIAHEVRNPLGGISLFAGLLIEELTGEGDKDKRACVEKIQRELSHLEKLVNDFLNYAREPKLDLQPVDIPRLCQDLTDIMAPRLQEKHQTLEVNISDDVIQAALCPEHTTLADETMLHRAILNLLINASQAAPHEGHLKLIVEFKRSKTAFTVQDDGPGIPKELISKLRLPFFTTKEKGIGLGLSLVSRFAVAHSGTLTLLPSDKGATFQILIPTRPVLQGDAVIDLSSPTPVAPEETSLDAIEPDNSMHSDNKE